MKHSLRFTGILLIAVMSLVTCKKKSPTQGNGDSLETCGAGKGYSVEFCRQVDHYGSGFGVAGQDWIRVDCIVGPEGATVSNCRNGTYHCSGRYKLTTFETARISLNWGGTTQYNTYEDFDISAKGEGTFSLTVAKKSGGEGNIFLDMSSGSSYMFATVLVNLNCNQASAGVVSTDRNESSVVRRIGGIVEKRHQYGFCQLEK